MLNIVTVCGAGVGSSMMMRLYAQQSLSEEGIKQMWRRQTLVLSIPMPLTL